MKGVHRTFAQTVLAQQDLMLERALATFWERVQKSDDGCWVWIGGSKNSYGHGRFNLFGVALAAHRVSWELAHGPIENDLNVLHRCDNPPCVRPDHLFLGTQQENIADMFRKGRARQVSGEEHSASKLTWKKVEEVRARYAAGNVTVRGLAAEFGMTNGAMWQAINHKTWRNPNVTY